MISIKEGVALAGMQPETMLAILIAADICVRQQVNFVITSVKEGKHGKGSKHYTGHAFDMRTRHMAFSQRDEIVTDLRVHLGNSYDVVLESDHIHIEFDPDLSNV